MVFWLQNPKVAYVAIPKQSLCWGCFANSHPTSSVPTLCPCCPCNGPTQVHKLLPNELWRIYGRMTSKTKARVHSQAAHESYRSQTQSDMRQPLPASQPQTLKDPGRWDQISWSKMESS